MDQESDDRFIGTWRLVSFVSEADDGTREFPLGEDAAGLLVYTASGYMSGQVMRRDRNTPPSTATFHESLGYIAYCGRFTVDWRTKEVEHRVEASLYPAWVGTAQRRSFAFGGNQLTLSAPAKRRGKAVVLRLVWERIGS